MTEVPRGLRIGDLVLGREHGRNGTGVVGFRGRRAESVAGEERTCFEVRE